MVLVTEAQVELQAIIWFKEIGYQYLCGSKIVEREDTRSVILKGRLEAALQRLNPDIPNTSDALAQLLVPGIPALVSCNKQVHNWMTKGVPVEFDRDGQTIGRQIKVFDFDDPARND